MTATLLGIGSSLMQLLPTYELTNMSQRSGGLSYEESSSTRWPLETLKFFAVPGAYKHYSPGDKYGTPNVLNYVNVNDLHGYVGMLSIVFAFAALFLKRNRFVMIFSILILASLLYGMGRSTQIFAILWQVLPGLKYFRFPIKIIFVIDFCLAVLAGIGFDRVREKLRNKTRKKYVLGVFSWLVVFIIFLDLYVNNFRLIQRVFPGEEWLRKPESVEFLESKLDRKNFRVFGQWTGNLALKEVPVFETKKQIQNLLPQNFNLIHRIPLNRQYSTIQLKFQRKIDKLRLSFDFDKKEFGLPEDYKRWLSLQSVKYMISDLPVEDEDLELREEIPFVEGVDHLIFLSDGSGETLSIPVEKAYLYENKSVFPRARFVNYAREVSSESEAFELLSRGGILI